ncbi:unnamed protein product, partial [Iphiclides podalirius]
MVASVHGYDRDWGPIIGPFTPGVVNIARDCSETNGNACLVIPSKEICKKKLAKPTVPWLPLPWWYFYCKWLMSPKTMTKSATTSSTVHEFYMNTLKNLTMYRERRIQNKFL